MSGDDPIRVVCKLYPEVDPQLHRALAGVPVRRRSEVLRRLAELGAMVEREGLAVTAANHAPGTAAQAMENTPTTAQQDESSAELQGLIEEAGRWM